MTGATGLADLFGRRRFAIHPGTERITALLARLGHPERNFQTIHVVGTNGKGSSAAFLASILTAAGYRTGLFTSPHLINYAERFQIDGSEIAPQHLDQLITRILALAAPDDTFFELTTALACSWFAESKTHVVVLEAGMGGMADATAAVNAIATLITPVALDHQQWLGTDLTTIAAQKAAIAEPGSPVICAPQQQEALAAITRHCRNNHNRLVLAGQDFQAGWDNEQSLHYTGVSTSLSGLCPGIPGRYQLWNAATALATAEHLSNAGLSIGSDALTNGLARARWPGRMERFSLPGDLELLLDGAHNPAGAAALAESLPFVQQGRRIVMLLGVMADKELEGVLSHLLPLAEQVVTVSPNQERALSAEQLAAVCTARGCRATAAGTTAQGLALIQRQGRPNDLIVVAGSLFTVGEARALLTGQICSAVRG